MTLTNWAKRLATNKTIQKSNNIFEGCRHPNFMNPFECGKSFHNKSFPKTIGTPTTPNRRFLDMLKQAGCNRVKPFLVGQNFHIAFQSSKISFYDFPNGFAGDKSFVFIGHNFSFMFHISYPGCQKSDWAFNFSASWLLVEIEIQPGSKILPWKKPRSLCP